MQQQHAPGQAGATRRNQVVVGLALPHEQFPLPKLLEFGVLAEQAGFAAVWVSHQGRYYPVEQARLYDVPSPPVPIYVAATGPKSMAMAGKIGDGLISFPEQASQPALRQAFEQGARAALKQPASMPILVVH